MGRVLNIWRGWSTKQRIALVGGVVAVLAGGAVAAYVILKRDSDVACPPPCELEAEPKEELKPKKTLQPVDWPVYGYTDQRTRYFPTDRVNPPYRSSVWSTQLGKLLEFSPVIAKGNLFLTDKSALVYSMDASTGKMNWKRKVGSLSAASPAFEDGRLFVVTLAPGDVQALDPKTGKVLWERDLGARSETSPLVYGDKVIVGNESGTVFGLNVRNGEIEWTVDSAGEVKGGVALEGGNAYFGNYAGEVFSVKADDGDVRWQTGTQGSSFGRAGRIYSTPAVGYGRVYVGSIDGRVYSFDQDDGSLAWSQSTGAEVYPGPALAEAPGAPPTVYVGSADKYFYALDAETGSIRWKQFTGGIILGAASVIGDVAYVGVIGPQNGTIGYDADNGERVYENELGEYNPAVTDGKRLYITGYSGIRAFLPDFRGKKKGKQGNDKPKPSKEAGRRGEKPPGGSGQDGSGRRG